MLTIFFFHSSPRSVKPEELLNVENKTKLNKKKSKKKSRKMAGLIDSLALRVQTED